MSTNKSNSMIFVGGTIVCCVVVLFYVLTNSKSQKQSSDSPGDSTVMTRELSPSAAATRVVVKSNNQEIDPIHRQTDSDLTRASNKYIHLYSTAQDLMAASEDIIVTSEQMKAEMKELTAQMTVEDFDEIQRGFLREIEAYENVLCGTMTVEQAAAHYFGGEYGGNTDWVKIVRNNARPDYVKKLREAYPNDLQDYIEKTADNRRKIVQKMELAMRILPPDLYDRGPRFWQGEYEKRIMEYAKDNIAGKDERFVDILPADIDEVIDGEIAEMTRKEENEYKAYLDQSGDEAGN